MRRPGPDYLNKHYEPFRSQKEMAEARQDLASLPFGIKETPPPTQSVEYRFPDLTYSLSLEDVQPSEYAFDRSKEEIQTMENQDLDPATKDAIDVRQRLGVESAEQVKVVKGLEARFDDGASFDLYRIVPEGWRVLYVPTEGEVTRGGAHLRLKTVVVKGNVLGFEGILTLTHECAHYHTLQSLGEEDYNRYHTALSRVSEGIKDREKAKEVTEDDLRLVYHAERDAWAYTLRQLKPFFQHYDKVAGQKSLRAAQKTIHEFALSKDTNVFRMLDPELRKSLEEASKRGFFDI